MTVVTLEANPEQLSRELVTALNRIYMDWHEIEQYDDAEFQLQALRLIEIQYEGDRIFARLSFRGRWYMAHVAHEWE
jgi:hypothetical protein